MTADDEADDVTDRGVSSMITISVIIATYNRSADLKETLRCAERQSLPQGVDYEVIVIDNNSNDDTKAVVGSFSAMGEKLKYLFEPQQGQSYAHNCGIREAGGKIIVLTDDDCIFKDDYLARIHQAFQEAGDTIGFMGGRIEPRWVNCSKPEWFDHLKPEWLKEFFWGPLAILDYGDEPFILDRRQMTHPEWKLFYGANLAIRKELFLRHGDFDINKVVSQDTELQLRFLNNGERGLYEPDIKTYHKVTPDRLTPRYYYRWYFLRGTLCEVQETYQRKFYHPFGIQLTFIKNTIYLFMKSLFTRSAIERKYMQCKGFFNLGQMVRIAKTQES